MSIAAPSNVQSTEPNEARLPGLLARRVHVQPRRVLRLRRLAHRQARHVRRRLPEGAPARRRLAVLLRHRQLRRRHRHRQPLRHGRPVRGPLQRRLPQGRARPPRELRDARSSRRPSRRCSTTGPTRASTRSPRRPRPAPPSATSTATTARPSPATASTAARMVGVQGDEPLRNDDNGHPVNRHFLDVPQDEPEIHAEPGFEDEITLVQPVRLPVALARDVEPVGGLGLRRQPVLPHDRGVHPADHPRQRPRRVVHPAVGRDHLGRRGPRLRPARAPR